jgi:putative phosphoesterase
MDGKKILVFSDTHGGITPLKAVMNWAKDQLPPEGSICAAAFLGDGISDLRHATDVTGFYSDWKLVSGNNDYDYSVPETAVFDFCDHHFFMCHGHRHNLYGGLRSLIAAAQINNANAVLFGHTHSPFCKTVDGILFVNPGSVSRPRCRLGATFAVIECTPGEPLKVEFWGIDERGRISQVKV